MKLGKVLEMLEGRTVLKVVATGNDGLSILCTDGLLITIESLTLISREKHNAEA